MTKKILLLLLLPLLLLSCQQKQPYTRTASELNGDFIHYGSKSLALQADGDRKNADIALAKAEEILNELRANYPNSKEALGLKEWSFEAIRQEWDLEE